MSLDVVLIPLPDSHGHARSFFMTKAGRELTAPPVLRSGWKTAGVLVLIWRTTSAFISNQNQYLVFEITPRLPKLQPDYSVEVSRSIRRYL
jgi:hypothetical protein